MINARRTKILVTLGPASRSNAEVSRLVRSGANGFRVNFSHGTEPELRGLIRTARAASKAIGRTSFVVADLQGPKIRLGGIEPSPTRIRSGGVWTLDADPSPGNQDRAPLESPELLRAARPGDSILLGDGSVVLRVRSRGPRSIRTTITSGGEVHSQMGAFLPSARLRTEILGPKDRADLRIAVEEGADYVALSFVRGPEDLRAARKFAASLPGGNEVGWVAKIERAEALDSIDGILRESDAIMVARGDLGIEVPLERIALEQKRLVERARAVGKPSIVATQMLLSMVTSPRPTRAEATDVANAVLDGADAVMLSEESAVGQFPSEAVRWLDRICRATESEGRIAPAGSPPPGAPPDVAERAIASAAVELAQGIGAGAIVAPTHSGRTARWVSSLRPKLPILAPTSVAATERRLGLVWGVYPSPVRAHLDLIGMRSVARALADGPGGVGRGAPLVLTAGYPIEGRPTNLLTVVEGARPSRRPARRASQ